MIAKFHYAVQISFILIDLLAIKMEKNSRTTLVPFYFDRFNGTCLTHKLEEILSTEIFRNKPDAYTMSL